VTTAYAKGAPEVILSTCTRFLTAEGEHTLTPAARTTIEEAAQEMASRALRVLAIAMRPAATLENAEKEMVLLGLVGMIDPPRPEVKEAIRTCEAAGIRPVMITGDHPLTARAIAYDLGMLKSDRVVTGAELEEIDEATLEREVDSIEVCRRRTSCASSRRCRRAVRSLP